MSSVAPKEICEIVVCYLGSLITIFHQDFTSRWRQRCGGHSSSGHSCTGQASSSPPPSSPPSAPIGLGTEEAPSTSMERVLPRTDSVSLTQPRETRCRKKEKFLLDGILTGHLCQLLHIGGVPKSYQLELPPGKPCREFSRLDY